MFDYWSFPEPVLAQRITQHTRTSSNRLSLSRMVAFDLSLLSSAMLSRLVDPRLRLMPILNARWYCGHTPCPLVQRAHIKLH